MATLDDVRDIAMRLPGVTEKQSWGSAFWRVKERGFVWERPLRKTDLAELGDAAPGGEVIGLRVADEGEKRALINGDPAVFFTVSHFDGYPAVLVRLDAVGSEELAELIEEAWLDRAPKRLAAAYLADRGGA